MTRDPWDIPTMQREHEEALREVPRYIIAEREDGFVVHVWTKDGVAPPSTYATKEMAAARLLQMMGIAHAIIPQAYPESVEIGVVKRADGGGMDETT